MGKRQVGNERVVCEKKLVVYESHDGSADCHRVQYD